MNTKDNTKKRKTKYKGELDLAGKKIPCYVLEDGTRVLSDRKSQEALGMVDEGDKKTSGKRLVRYLEQKSLKPFLYKGKKVDHYDPIVCYDGNQKISGRRATLLIDICDAFLEARKHIKLDTRQEIIAKESEIIVRTTAKVGIIALVDEATGYQYERERFELQKIFKLLVLEDGIFSELKKMFPLDYYKELFGVYDIPFTAENIRRKPRFIGWLTSELVYKNLPKGSFVLAKIKERTPKSLKGHYGKRFYRSLTPIGRKALEERINTVKTLAWVSKSNRNKFRRLVKERYRLERNLPYIDLEAIDIKDGNRIAEKSDPDKLLDACINTPPITLKQLQKELKEEREYKQNSKDKKSCE